MSPPRNQLTTKTRFWVQRAPSQSLPVKLEVRSGNQKRKKGKKPRLGWTFHPTPNDPPLRTHFVLCMWGGVTDIITHAKFHLNRFTSFGSPGGRNSPFLIGSWRMALTTVLRTNVLHCDIAGWISPRKLKIADIFVSVNFWSHSGTSCRYSCFS